MGASNAASRWRGFPSAAIFAGSYFAALGASGMELGIAIKTVATIVAIVGFALFFATQLRIIRTLDELGQRIQLEALAIAFPLSIALLMLLGLLERFLDLPSDDLSYRHIWPIMVLFYFGGLAIARRRYS